MDLPKVDEFVVRIKTDYCGRCSICSSICPFEALSLDPEAKEVKLDIEKCQVCGICYSVCPAGAIESVYYDPKVLVRYLISRMQVCESKVLVLTCRGSIPDSEDIKDITEVDSFIPLCLPCVGRASAELFLQALSLGFKRIIVIPCQQDFCHFKDGSIVSARRISLLRSLLYQLGYDSNAIALETYRAVAQVDNNKCTACLTCVRVCEKYHASLVNQTCDIEIDVSKCSGCGVCIGECPAQAIQYKIVRGQLVPERT